VGSDAGNLFVGPGNPLVESIADRAALDLVLNDSKTDEVPAREQPGAHGILARKHAVKGERHVVIFQELGDGEEVGDAYFRLPAFAFRIARVEIRDLFRQSEDAGLAGDHQEAVMRLAAEPRSP